MHRLVDHSREGRRVAGDGDGDGDLPNRSIVASGVTRTSFDGSRLGVRSVPSSDIFTGECSRDATGAIEQCGVALPPAESLLSNQRL